MRIRIITQQFLGFLLINNKMLLLNLIYKAKPIGTVRLWIVTQKTK